MKFGIGQSAPRKEDARFVTGHGRFVDDIAAPSAFHAAIVRSPLSHARIAKVDVSAAKTMPGVRAVLTGRDYAGDGIGGISCHTIFPGMHRNPVNPPYAALAKDRVLYAGAPVALVIAETAEKAEEAAETVEVDYEDLPAVLRASEARAKGAPQIWSEAKGNLAFTVDLGDAPATDAGFAAAAHVTRLALHNNRVSANAMEMRCALAHYEQGDGRLTFHASTQQPHAVRADIARALGLPETNVRVIAPDVGGGFGMKGGIHPEDILIAWAARRLRATVRWQATRSESLLADYHGRDQQVEAELALDADGRILALRMSCDVNAGAFLSPGGGVSPMFAAALATGVYRVPAAHSVARAVYTNTSPTQPYRGAGRPEAAYLIERLIDLAARETGRDRIELRRLNMLSAAQMPHQTPLLYKIDSGDYAAVLDRALQLGNWADADKRKAKAKKRGMLRGIGIALHMENAGLANDAAEIRFDPSGSVTVIAGTFSHGQGHETVYAQMVSDWLDVPFEKIRLVQGDTDAVSYGRGTVASRSMINGGGALRVAADKVIEKGSAIAGHLMEAAPEDIVFENGSFTVAGTDRSMPIAQIAALSFKPILPPDLGLGLSGQGDFLLQGFTFPNGCQIAEVEIDPETGATRVIRIDSVDDVGTVINPMLLDGQMVGGITQGIGQALMEDVVYDKTGQLLSGSFMDYTMPRAEDVPPITVETLSTPTATNPLGVKGAGEAGTVGATPAVISAVLDALAEHGVTDIALPATPERIWRALNGRD